MLPAEGITEKTATGCWFLRMENSEELDAEPCGVVTVITRGPVAELLDTENVTSSEVPFPKVISST